MRKIQILSAFVVVLAFSALAVASASATLWLKNGVSITQLEPANTHGYLLLHHFNGTVGSVLALCPSGAPNTLALFDGTVGPNGEDLIETALDSTGKLISSTNKLSCTQKVENFFCKTGALVLVWPDHMPWKTQLELIGGVTYDHFFSDGLGEPGYTAECNGVSVLCSGLDRAKFLENTVSGALFHFEGELTANCSDGGTGKTLGLGTVLGFTVS